jgi:hypothetical protein
VRWAVCKSVFQSRFGAEITNPLLRAARCALEFDNYSGETIVRADRSARNDAESCIWNKADDRVTGFREPVSYSRIDDLVGRGVPAVVKNYIPRSSYVGRP